MTQKAIYMYDFYSFYVKKKFWLLSHFPMFQVWQRSLLVKGSRLASGAACWAWNLGGWDGAAAVGRRLALEDSRIDLQDLQEKRYIKHTYTILSVPKALHQTYIYHTFCT